MLFTRVRAQTSFSFAQEFLDSFFQLADTWTDGVQEAEYCLFLRAILLTLRNDFSFQDRLLRNGGADRGEDGGGGGIELCYRFFAAASRVQRWYRRNRHLWQRNKSKSSKPVVVNRDALVYRFVDDGSSAKDAAADAMARRIQAVSRGRAQRVRMGRQRKGAIRLQAVSRGRAQRRELARQRHRYAVTSQGLLQHSRVSSMKLGGMRCNQTAQSRPALALPLPLRAASYRDRSARAASHHAAAATLQSAFRKLESRSRFFRLSTKVLEVIIMQQDQVVYEAYRAAHAAAACARVCQQEAESIVNELLAESESQASDSDADTGTDTGTQAGAHAGTHTDIGTARGRNPRHPAGIINSNDSKHTNVARSSSGGSKLIGDKQFHSDTGGGCSYFDDDTAGGSGVGSTRSNPSSVGAQVPLPLFVLEPQGENAEGTLGTAELQADHSSDGDQTVMSIESLPTSADEARKVEEEEDGEEKGGVEQQENRMQEGEFRKSTHESSEGSSIRSSAQLLTGKDGSQPQVSGTVLTTGNVKTQRGSLSARVQEHKALIIAQVQAQKDRLRMRRERLWAEQVMQKKKKRQQRQRHRKKTQQQQQHRPQQLDPTACQPKAASRTAPAVVSTNEMVSISDDGESQASNPNWKTEKVEAAATAATDGKEW